MKLWSVFCILFLTACGVVNNELPSNTETPVPPTSTPYYVVVTQIVTVQRTVVVTATPKPLFAQECLNTAVTQTDLNACAFLEAQLAKEEMEKIISKIKFSSKQDEQDFNKLQGDWESQIAKDCEFLFAQTIKDANGNLYYKGGSMAPMQRGFCLAEQYKRRIQDLKFAYFPQ